MAEEIELKAKRLAAPASDAAQPAGRDPGASAGGFQTFDPEPGAELAALSREPHPARAFYRSDAWTAIIRNHFHERIAKRSSRGLKPR